MKREIYRPSEDEKERNARMRQRRSAVRRAARRDYARAVKAAWIAANKKDATP